MTGRTHDAIGFTALVTVAILLTPESINIPTFTLCIVGNVIGSLLPDIDQGSNKLWSLLPGDFIIPKIGRRIFYKHRTITHSILGGYLLYTFLKFALPRVFNPGYINTNMVMVSILIGFIMHLVADSLTREGLPLFFPFKWKIGFPPIEALRIPTDGIIEHLVVLPAIGVYLIWLCFTNQDKLLIILKMLHK